MFFLQILFLNVRTTYLGYFLINLFFIILTFYAHTEVTIRRIWRKVYNLYKREIDNYIAKEKITFLLFE